MKEERKRQKQLESNFEEEYFEDHGGGGIQPVCVCVCLCGYQRARAFYKFFISRHAVFFQFPMCEVELLMLE